METKIICPVCKTRFESQPKKCIKCGYPFSASERERSIYVGRQILRKSKISNTKEKIKRARIILWLVGVLNIVSSIKFINAENFIFYFFISLTFGLIFIAFGFYTYRKPFVSVLIPLILLLLGYTIETIADPRTILNGIVLKVIIISSLVYGLISIIEAEKVRNENEFLKEHKYAE